VPIDPSSLPAAFYEPDGIHLNAEGAAFFTAALETDLPRKIAALEATSCPRAQGCSLSQRDLDSPRVQ
jgi:hypothetical protein